MSASDFHGHPWQWFGHLSYSQHGEDLVFAAAFHRLGIERPSYLDIGANHPLIISSTALLYARGSSGIDVDANPEYIEAFRIARPRDTVVLAGVAPTRGKMTFYSFEGESSGRSSFSKTEIDRLTAQYPAMRPKEVEIQAVTINDIVDEYAGGKFPDLLCIDVEQLDTAVLASADFSKSQPKLICAEVIHDEGSPAPEIYGVLAAKGYERYVRMGSNVIFIERPLLHRIW